LAAQLGNYAMSHQPVELRFVRLKVGVLFSMLHVTRRSPSNRCHRWTL
jgi:hypothetical protein